MKACVKLILVCVLGSGLIFLSACDFSQKKNSSDEGPGPLDVDVIIDEGVPVGVQLRAAPTVNSVSLNWDAISNAVDYEVSRQQVGEDEIIESTAGATHFSFAAQSDSTYKIWVAALDSSGRMINKSKLITVKTASPEALKFSDAGL
jgi:hypothetical protein